MPHAMLIGESKVYMVYTHTGCHLNIRTLDSRAHLVLPTKLASAGDALLRYLKRYILRTINQHSGRFYQFSVIISSYMHLNLSGNVPEEFGGRVWTI